ncbi:MAG: hypothetical protein QM645_01800 [Asticcacaulis sp.]
MYNRRHILSAGLLSAFGALGSDALSAEAGASVKPSDIISLWPDSHLLKNDPAVQEDIRISGTPAVRRISGVTAPRLEVYRPESPNGTALVIIPGGGYKHISADIEGADIARVFTAKGISCFVLIYRLPIAGAVPQPHLPLADAQRAMRVLKARAVALNIQARPHRRHGLQRGRTCVCHAGGAL